MKILVLTGSPHREGTTALLAEEFIRGARERGHEIARLDTAFLNIHPCAACEHCGGGSAPCVFQDDFAAAVPRLLEAELVAFVTPLYYFGASAQLKTAIDRFHGVNRALKSAGKKAVLLCAAADAEEHIMRGVAGSYREMLDYLGWQDCGQVLARSCGDRAAVLKTEYPRQADELGRKAF